MINQEALVELKQILLEEYGQEIDLPEVEKVGNHLLEIFETLVVKTKNKNQYETQRLPSIT